MSAPQWSRTDDDTGLLLSLVAEPDPGIQAELEWAEYIAALHLVSLTTGRLVRPNTLRPFLRGKVAPRRIGAFTHRALSLGIVEYTGDYEISDDTEGRNGGKPCRILRWVGVA